MKKAVSLFLLFTGSLLLLAGLHEMYTWIFEERSSSHIQSVIACYLFGGFAIKYGLKYSGKKKANTIGS